MTDDIKAPLIDAAVLDAVGAAIGCTTTPIIGRIPLAAVVDLSPLNALSPDASTDDLEAALLRVRESLPAETDALTREATREAIRRQFPNVPPRMRDAALRPPARTTATPAVPVAAATNPDSITQKDDEPADEAVDGAALLDETLMLIRRHVVLTEAQAIAVVLWIGAAYVVAALDLIAILLVTAPTLRSGKTTLLTLLSAIVPRALIASNLTGAVLARAIAAFAPTLLADEADTWLTDEASELRGIMNCGHTRASAYILRCAPETHAPQLIPCFGARVLAMIRRPPSTISDRSIAIELRRKRADEQIHRLRLDRLHVEHTALRRRWRRWANHHLDAIRGVEPSVPAELHDRAQDNWRPLLAVADLVGEKWPVRSRVAAVEVSGAHLADDDSENIALLADVKTVFAAKFEDIEKNEKAYLSSDDIITALKAMAEAPWADHNKGRGLSTGQLAKGLRDFGTGPLGLRTRKTRLDADRTGQRWHAKDFTDAWSRYLPSGPERPERPEHPEQPNESGPKSEISDPEQNANVPGPKNDVSSIKTGSVPGVPGSDPENDHSASGCTCVALGADAPCAWCDGLDRSTPADSEEADDAVY